MAISYKRIFWFLFAVCVFLLFFRLGRADMMGDDGHYAFRALGYFDYLASDKQTTPLQWFGTRPWWSLLSFHDHPPLVFLIQHIFFTLLGASMFVSRLAAAFAALGSAIVLYCLARDSLGERTALFSTGAFVLNNYFIWTGRTGILEGVMIFFALAGLLFFRRGYEKPKNFLWAGLFFGLAFLSKYSFLFFLPGILLYCLWRACCEKNWKFFTKKYLLLGSLIFLCTITPVTVFNIGTFLARGHFDLQFSQLLLPASSLDKDWPILSDRVHAGNFFGTTVALTKLISDGSGAPYALVFIFSLGYLWYLARVRGMKIDLFPIFIFLSIFCCFFFVGGQGLWLGILAPFAALIIGQALAEVPVSAPFLGLVSLLCAYFFFFIINTNILLLPIGTERILYSPLRVENHGYRQLDEKMTKLLGSVRPTPDIMEGVRRVWYGDFDLKAVDFSVQHYTSKPESKILVVYDLNTDWFNTIWIFQKWNFYNHFFVATSEEFSRNARHADTLAILEEKIDTIVFVEAAPKNRARSVIDSPYTLLIAEHFNELGVVPEVLRDDAGDPAFYIYTANLADVFAKPLDVSSVQ
jgi:4-amino-4-deoxy-L-arabinose transferase-like glycosyltransferase